VWERGGSPLWLGGAVIALTLAIAIKPTALALLAALAYGGWEARGWRFFRDWQVWAGLLAALGLAFAYYLDAYRLGSQYLTMEVWSGGVRFRAGEVLTSPSFWALMLWRFTGMAFTSVGFTLVAVGFAASWREPKLRILAVWLLALGATVLAAPGAYQTNGYYVLPFLLPAAGLIGWAWERVSYVTWRAGAVLLAVCFAVTAVWRAHDMYATDPSPLEAGRVLQRIAPERATVVVYPAEYPVSYYLGRRAWIGKGEYGHPELKGMRPSAYVRRCAARGASFAVYLMHPDASRADPAARAYLESEFGIAARGERFIIFDLRRRVSRVAGAGTSTPP
jgi:hypothetical protein